MRILLCRECDGHRFVVFTAWLPAAEAGLVARIYGACIGCGKSWPLENIQWPMEKP